MSTNSHPKHKQSRLGSEKIDKTSSHYSGLIKIKVFPGSKKEEVIQTTKDSFIIKVKPKAQEGKANQRVKEVLAKFLNLPQSHFRIIKGGHQKNKIIRIDN